MKRTNPSRREFLWLASASTVALAQGVSTRNVKPVPRGKPSGLPFLAHFTDVAASAGLTFPVIYGGLTQKNYIVETVGCGVAFLDFDNDGWLDIFAANGHAAPRRMNFRPRNTAPFCGREKTDFT